MPVVQAFVKLESLPNIPRERREAYADLAMSIFQQHPPADPHSLTEGRDVQQLGPEGKGHKRQDGSGPDAVQASKDQVRGSMALWRGHVGRPNQGLQQHKV